MEKIISALKSLLRIRSRKAIKYYNSGIYYGSKHDHEKALLRFTKAVNEDPKFARAYGGMGVSYHKIHQNDKAIECFQKVIELEPKGEASKLAEKALRELEHVRNALRSETDVNTKDGDGFTALMRAAGWGDIKTLRALLNSGADVNATITLVVQP